MKTVDFLKNNNIDVDHGLELLGDIDFYNETMTDFYNSYNERVTNLTNYKNSNDTENYGILAHAIKSDCKYLGIMSFADMSYNHEMAGKSADINFINTNFDAYITEYTRIINILKEYLEV